MNLSEMTYKEMVEMSATLQQAMAIKRANEVKEALRILMDAYGLSKDEMKSCLDGEDSINPITSLEVVENPQIEDEVPLALPDPSKEDEVETEVSINPEPQEHSGSGRFARRIPRLYDRTVPLPSGSRDAAVAFFRKM